MILTAAATEAEFDISSIKELMDGFDPAALLPEVSSIVSIVQTVCIIAVLAAPVILLLLGLGYLLFAPKEANYYFGYRTAFGMGSVSAWRRTQKVAGIVFVGLGLVLTLIMLVVIFSTGGMDAMDMVWLCVKCLLWQVVLILAAVFSINSITAATFDYKGNKRKKQ